MQFGFATLICQSDNFGGLFTLRKKKFQKNFKKKVLNRDNNSMQKWDQEHGVEPGTIIRKTGKTKSKTLKRKIGSDMASSNKKKAKMEHPTYNSMWSVIDQYGCAGSLNTYSMAHTMRCAEETESKLVNTAERTILGFLEQNRLKWENGGTEDKGPEQMRILSSKWPEKVKGRRILWTSTQDNIYVTTGGSPKWLTDLWDGATGLQKSLFFGDRQVLERVDGLPLKQEKTLTGLCSPPLSGGMDTMVKKM